MGKTIDFRTMGRGATFPNYSDASNTLKQVKLHSQMAFRYE